jgi:hypothetical protein
MTFTRNALANDLRNRYIVRETAREGHKGKGRKITYGFWKVLPGLRKWKE